MSETPTIEQAAEKGILQILSSRKSCSKTDLIYNVSLNRDKRFKRSDMSIAVSDAIERLTQRGWITQVDNAWHRYSITESGQAVYAQQAAISL